MDNLFKELETLGIENLDGIELYKKDREIKKTMPSTNGLSNDILYLRKTVCPICEQHFKTPTVRVGRVRFKGTDLDLRPQYEGFDPMLYDVVACPSCGYAALNKYFKTVSDFKCVNVRQKISANYKGKNYPEVFEYKIAIERYKLAIVCGIVGQDPTSRKAYLCMKIAWLYRSYAETVIRDEELIKELNSYEVSFLKQALEGFLIAFEKESFPIMGIDQGMMEYLIAELYRRTGDVKSARLWLSKVLKRPGTAKRLQDKISEVRKLIQEEISKQQ